MSSFANQNSLLITIFTENVIIARGTFHLETYTMLHKERMESGSDRLKMGEFHGPLNDGSKRLTVH